MKADAVRATAIGCLRASVVARRMGESSQAIEQALAAYDAAWQLGAAGRALRAAASRAAARGALVGPPRVEVSESEQIARAEYASWATSGVAWGLW